jgi:tetratricopeptide (TPR) repeat protein
MFAEDPATRVTAARLLAGMGNPQAAVEALDGLPPDRAQSADVLLLRAAMLVGTQDKDKVATARKAVAEARDKFPQEPAFWVFLATTEADPKDGLAVLDRAQAAAGNGVRIRLARAALLARQKADPAAVRAVEAGADQLPAADRTALAFGLAEVYLRVGARPDAERLLREAADRQPGDLTVLFRLFEVSAATADPNRLEALRQAAEKAEGPDGAVWRVIDAYKSLRASQAGDPAGDLRHARTRLAEAGKLRPEWYWVPLLEADIESAQGRPDAAAELYARAVRLGASQPAVVERAVALLIDRRRGDEAQQLIADVRRRAPALTETLERYDVWGQAQRGASAEDLLERLKTTAPETSAKARDHLFRAGVLAAADRPKEAEAAYRKAAAVEPAAPEAWVGLVTFLARSNRADEARAEIAKAAKAVPADKLPLVLGPCYDAVGDRAEAEKQYAQAAAGSDPAALRALAWFYVVGGDAAKAEPVLRRLLADPNQKRWARRTLALVLAAGGFAQGTEALDLLEANLKEFPDSPEDLRARSLVQASRPEGRPQAIKDMEASFSRLPASPVEEFMLARLYELDDQWPNANKRMLDAVTRPGGDAPAFLAAYVAALLRHKDADAAGRWLDRLKEKAKGPSAVVVELQARLDAARDRKADAAAAVKAYVAAAAKEKPNPNLHRWAGTLLAEVGLKAEAEEYFREYVRAAEKADPNAPLVLADFLARHQNRVGDALALCVDALNRLDPELVARQTVAVLRLGDATAAHYAQAEGVIQKAARAKPRSADIPVSFADLRDAQGRYDDAKALYREILAAAPTNVLALNNLAWLLALHEGKTGEAVELLEQRAIKLVGRDGNLLDTLGVVRLTGNDTARAVADLTAACAQDARPERYFHLAQAHLKAGNKADALRAMKKAVQDLKLTKKDLHRLEWKAFDELLAMIGG